MYNLNIVVTIYSKDRSWGKEGIFRAQKAIKYPFIPRSGDLFEFEDNCLEPINRVAFMLNKEIFIYIDMDRSNDDREDLQEAVEIFKECGWLSY